MTNEVPMMEQVIVPPQTSNKRAVIIIIVLIGLTLVALGVVGWLYGQNQEMKKQLATISTIDSGLLMG